MNSYEILKQLHLLHRYKGLDDSQRRSIQTAIRHIEGQDGEIAKLREDITNVEFDDED